MTMRSMMMCGGRKHEKSQNDPRRPLADVYCVISLGLLNEKKEKRPVTFDVF